ncbi:MAG: RadC family protein [Chitinophagales bacterium]
MEKPESNSIKNWELKDRPREKLEDIGKQELSDAELLAILIGSGSREASAVELCTQILNYANNDLSVLGKMSVNDLCKFKGIGPAKAITIVAALELGRRRQAENIQDLKKIGSSKDVYHIFLSLLADIPHEEFWVLYLNQANKIIGKEKISSGGIASTIADKRIIIKSAIDRLASGIILVHNHPSGNLKPSQSDIDLTNKTKAAAKLFDISVFDHIIVSSAGYYSFADDDMI